MTSNELKELVKQHFSLTEATTEAVVKETFGEIMDENKAFTILFPGDEIKVGDEVRVRTADGQELTAPDGEHRLEDGAMIKVEDGKVVEYTSEAEIEEREGEELAVDGEVEQPAEVEGVEVEKMAGETEEEEEMMEDEMPEAEDVVKAVIEAIGEEMKSIKEEMEALKAKMAELEDAPATDKAMPEMMSTDKAMKPTADVFNSARFNAVMERFSK